MSQKINEQASIIFDAFGVKKSYVDNISERLSNITDEAMRNQKPIGFVAQKVRDAFDAKELEIIATMFVVSIINIKNKEGCDCDECRASRGELVEEDVVSALRRTIEEEFPGMNPIIQTIPLNKKGRTDC